MIIDDYDDEYYEGKIKMWELLEKEYDEGGIKYIDGYTGSIYKENEYFRRFYMICYELHKLLINDLRKTGTLIRPKKSDMFKYMKSYGKESFIRESICISHCC